MAKVKMSAERDLRQVADKDVEEVGHGLALRKGSALICTCSWRRRWRS